MEKTAIDDVDSRTSPAAVKRPIAAALGATDCALNYYELEPGDAFGFGYHRHADQEELFYVLSGTATFDTEDGAVTVSDGEAIRFAPGEWQRGHNESDDLVRALAVGAPADTGTVEIRRDCPDCGRRREVRIEPADQARTVVCAVCGTEIDRYT